MRNHKKSNKQFTSRQMGTLKDKIKIPDDFDGAFADEIADMFEGKTDKNLVKNSNQQSLMVDIN